MNGRIWCLGAYSAGPLDCTVVDDSRIGRGWSGRFFSAFVGQLARSAEGAAPRAAKHTHDLYTHMHCVRK